MKNIFNYTNLFLIVLLLTAFANRSAAQDGKAIFNSKCSACHIMGKDGTGPNLQGVKAKWEGEEEFLYEWVMNAPKVIAEGKSARAQAVKDYSVTNMPVQDVTMEDAQAIIAYVDAWTPPIVEATPGDRGTTGEAVVYVPDYEKNLTTFYVLLLVIGLLLISILVISKSTQALIKSDLFREKIIERKNSSSSNKGTLALIGFLFLGFGANAMSTEIPANAVKENLWLYVENSDLYTLLIIALILLGFLLHMVNMFYGVLKMIRPEATKETIAARISLRKKKRASLAKMLTGAVAIEEEHKIDLGHDYDGIRELDNPMPPWWLAGFFISIVFAVVYMFHYHVLGTGDLQEAEYAKVMEIETAKVQEYLKAQAMDVDETNATLMTSNDDLMKGKALFINNCTVCHKEDGRGEAGPNLTDNYWIYGGDIKDIFKVIKKGAPNGMPEHQSKFNPIQIQQVASYVKTLDYVSPADGGKEVQGELYEAAEREEVESEKAPAEVLSAQVIEEKLDK
jgi:cytochrome c oxidase cbb3-type subunit 3